MPPSLATTSRRRASASTSSIPRGHELVLALAPKFDVVAENFKSGTADRLGIGYDDIHRGAPLVHLSIDLGIRQHRPDPVHGAWPAFAPIVEAMSGIYELKRHDNEPGDGSGRRPRRPDRGALRDDRRPRRPAAARFPLFPGVGQYIDIAMFDSIVTMTDVVMKVLVARPAGRRGEPPHLARLPDRRRMDHHPDGTRAPVRRAHEADRPSRVGRRRALCHPSGLGRPPRRRPAARHREVGERHDQDGGVRRAGRGGHRCRPLLQRRRGGRGSSPPGPGNGRGHSTIRRRATARAHPRQPRADDPGSSLDTKNGCPGSESTPRTCSHTSWRSARTRSTISCGRAWWPERPSVSRARGGPRPRRGQGSPRRSRATARHRAGAR